LVNVRRSFAACAAAAALIAAIVLGNAGRAPAAGEPAPQSVTIAYQPGIGYANLIALKESGALEKRFPHTAFEWKVLASGSAIRDGMIAGQIQIGAGGSPPFLIAWDRGVDVKLIGALDEASLWLMTRAPNVHNLKDLSRSARIGLPAPDSIQAIVLRKAAQQQLGDAHAFDANLVAIAHPLGLAALAGGQIDAHLTSPPFQEEEQAAGAHPILKSYDVFGRSTFNVIYTTGAFAKQYPAFVTGFARELRTATELVAKNPQLVSEYLAKDAGGGTPAATFKRWLASASITWTTVPHGLLGYAKFMKEIGYLSKAPANIGELELPVAAGQGD
jgi:NitT/TauT family transport system substrate-binding protein